jgi:parvulin-like peptidyl-prolyl isomerase
MAGMNPRAASRQSRTGEVESRDALVVVAAIVVLAITALIVLAGLFFTWYRPPRAAALTVEGSAITALQVQHRLQYLMFFESADVGSDQTQFVSKTLDRMERDEIVRRRAPALVGDVDADAVQQHLRTALAPPVPPAPTTNTPGVTIAQPTATPMSDEEYAKALKSRLTTSGMSKGELETVARAEVLETKLRAHFREGLSKSGSQLQLVVARLTDRAKADQVRAIGLRPGVDFAQVANFNSATGGGPTGDLGWVLPEELKPAVRDAIKPLAAGGLSEVTPNGIYFEVYKVAAVDASREYETKQLDTLVDGRFTAWIEEERPQVKMERVLSSGTEQWIRDQAIAAFRAGQPGG